LDRSVVDLRSIGPRADAETIRATAEVDGYVHVRGALSREIVVAMRAALVRLCIAQSWARTGDNGSDIAAVEGVRTPLWHEKRFIALQREALACAELTALREDPGLHRTLEAIAGEPVRGERGDVLRVVLPASVERTTRPHQDAAYLGTAGRIWVAWIPLGDCPKALGPLAIWPGSHRRGLLAHAKGPDFTLGCQVPGDLPCAASDLVIGDVLVFSSMTLHAALPNLTRDGVRLSVDLRFQPASEAWPPGTDCG